jgi:hypothetical protein
MVESAEFLNLEQLLRRLRAGLPDLVTHYQIASLGVFGSYVRGEQGVESDLDLLIEFHEPPGLFDFVRLENELSEMLGVQVDLVMKSALKPTIRRYILDEVQRV